MAKFYYTDPGTELAFGDKNRASKNDRLFQLRLKWTMTSMAATKLVNACMPMVV